MTFPVFVTHVDTVSVDFPGRSPSHCSVIFWGLKDQDGMDHLQDKLAEIASVLNISPLPTKKDLKSGDHFCALVNGEWLRARVIESQSNKFSTESVNLVDIFCVDYGFQHLVPLHFIRMIPDWCALLKAQPPMASKFVLGDVLAEKFSQQKEFCMQYLKTNMVNHTFSASPLGLIEDCEIVRLHTAKGDLLAKILLEKNLVEVGDTYSTAYSVSVPDIKSLIPPPNLLKKALATPISNCRPSYGADHSLAYYALSFDVGCESLVSVTSIQNGLRKFILRRLSPDMESGRMLVDLSLKEIKKKLPPIVNPVRGKVCVVSKDGTLFRGLISECKANNMFYVYLVDDGLFEDVPLSHLFEITPLLMKSPMYSMPVSLDEADLFDSFDQTLVKKAFTSIVLGRTLIAKIPLDFNLTRPKKLTLLDSNRRNVKDLIKTIVKGETGSASLNESNVIVGSEVSVKIVEMSQPTKSYSLMPVTIGEPVNVSAVCECPDNLFLSPVTPPDDSILKDLESYYSSLSSEEMIETEPRVGLPCVVRYTDDNQFYRSEILELNESTAKVLFVDYGNTQETPLGELKQMTPKFMHLPMMVWKCHLKGVILSKKPVAPGTEIKQHLNACFLVDDLTARFHPIDDAGSFPVELQVPELGDVATYLVKHGIMERPLVDGTNEAVAIRATISGSGRKSPVLVSPVLSVATDYSRTRMPKIPPVVVQPDEVLLVTCCDRVGHFFGQLDRRQAGDLRAMEKELMENYDRLTTLLYNDDDIQDRIGDHGIMRWKKDNKLYRVEVVNELFDDEVLVLMVDYGFICSVSRFDIRAPVIFASNATEMKLFTQPPFGISCQVESYLPQVSKMSSSIWKGKLVGKPVRVQVGEKSADNGRYKVSFPDCFVNSLIFAASK